MHIGEIGGGGGGPPPMQFDPGPVGLGQPGPGPMEMPQTGFPSPMEPMGPAHAAWDGQSGFDPTGGMGGIQMSPAPSMNPMAAPTADNWWAPQPQMPALTD